MFKAYLEFREGKDPAAPASFPPPTKVELHFLFVGTKSEWGNFLKDGNLRRGSRYLFLVHSVDQHTLHGLPVRMGLKYVISICHPGNMDPHMERATFFFEMDPYIAIQMDDKLAPGKTFGATLDVYQKRIDPFAKCECGCSKLGLPRHSTWCPLYQENYD